MENLGTAKRKWWVAVLLSFFMPGLGQVYNGQPRKGIVFWLIQLSFFGLFIFPFAFFSKISFWFSAAVGEIAWRFVAAADGGLSATRLRGYILRPYNKGWVYLLILILAMGINSGIKLLIRENFIQAFRIPSAAMEPTILVGDYILTDRRIAARSPARGDIVVYKYPEDPTKDFIKRVVAVGGDTVEGKDKILYVNGVPVGDEYAVHLEKDVVPATQNPRDNFGPRRVPEGSYFTMGDNRDRSYDSRFWGFVPKENIKGKAMVIYWSWDAENQKVRWERIGKEIR